MQVERQMGMRIFGQKFHKNGDISGSWGRISMRFGQTEAVICILVLCKRQVWENSVARERDPSRFSKNVKILENVEKI